VDNGSSTPDYEEIRRLHPEVHVVVNLDNLGWSGGNNSGIELAKKLGCDFFLLLNNDTVVAPSIAEEMVDAAAANSSFGVIGAIIRYMDEPGVVMTDGVVFNQSEVSGEFFERKPVSQSNQKPARLQEVDIVNGCCLMFSAAVLERIGPIDDRFFLIHEESDFCLRAIRSGFQCGVLGRALVWHKGSSTFKRVGASWQRYYDVRNLGLLLAKHAGKIKGRRGTLASLKHFVARVLYLYSRALSSKDSSDLRAVVDGLHDLCLGRYGRYERDAKRYFSSVFKFGLAALVRLRHLWR
jgi:hypothetical protein